MEKIPSSSDTGSARLDSPSLPKEASKESSAIGELAGMKVTDNTKEKINNFSSLTNDNLKEGSIKRRSLSLQSFVQVGASPAAETASTVDLSPFTPFSPIIREEPFLLKTIQEKRTLLQQKIKGAQEVVFSSAQEGYNDLNQCQQHYIQNLERILEAADDLSPMSYDSENITKVESIVDSLIWNAEELKTYTEELIADNIEGKKRPYNGALGEFRETFEHTLDGLHNIKIGNQDQARIDICLARKCFSRFRELHAREEKKPEVADLFNKAAFYYSKAIKKKSFGPEAREGVGDCFFSAGTQLNRGNSEFSKRYEKAAVHLEKGNQPSSSQAEADIRLHAETAEFWILSANNARNALSAHQANKMDLAQFYQNAQECFVQAAESLNSEERKLLRQAGNSFVMAAELINEPLLSSVNDTLGCSYREQVTAISRGNKEAFKYFQTANAKLSDAKFYLELGEGGKVSRRAARPHVESGKLYYQAGKALLKGEKKIAALYAEVAEYHREKITSGHPQDVLAMLQKAAKHSLRAIQFYRAGKEESTIDFYISAVNEMRNAARGEEFRAVEEWERAVECYYLAIIKEEKQSSPNQDAVMQLFKSAAKYHKIAAEEIKRDPAKEGNDIFSLKTVASNLELAAEALQEGDQELAEAYQNFAASCYYFAVASKPSLVKHLPEALRFGLREESAPNEGACVYWSKAAANNFKKINELLEVRAIKPSGEVEPSASNEASAV